MLIFMKKSNHVRNTLSWSKLMLRNTHIMSIGLSSIMLLLGACSPKTNNQENGQQTASATLTTEQQIAQTVRKFSSTPQDAHDIALIKNYKDKFQTMSIEFEKDLARLKQDGYLTTDMEKDRHRDQALSAMNMLKALELDTEQGRYIQGLYYQYWETQYQHYETNSTAPVNTPTNELSQAEAQLNYWQSIQH